MTDKRKTTTIALLAIMAVGVGMFMISGYDSTSLLSKVQTDPAEFTNVDYDPDAIHGQWISIDPIEISQYSKFVVKGNIIDVNKKSIMVAPVDPDVLRDGKPFEPRIDATVYTVQIEDSLKGEKQNQIEITSLFPSKIGYSVDDQVLVMVTPIEDRFEMIGGPFSMFKLKDEQAIGHEFTFEQDALIDFIKESEDKSHELTKK
jgi:hypothetical protein